MTISSPKGIIKSDSAQYLERFSFPLQIPTVSLPAEKKGNGKKAETTQTPEEGKSSPTEETTPSFEEPTVRSKTEEEAEEMLERAAKQAAEILRKAKEEAESLKSQAFLNGREEGYQKGLEEGTADGQAKAYQMINDQQEEFRKSIETAVRSIETAKKACIEKYLETLKECSLAVAEKVICTSLKSSGEIIKRMLIAETEKLKKTDWVKIYMDRTDYSMMMETDADVLSELSMLSDNIKFVVMNKGDSGSCIIEMPEEIIDISVDTQMENIRDLLETIQL